MAAFRDTSVKAIVAFRGGWGCARLLPLLDYAVIRANPKPFIGYSDATSCVAAIAWYVSHLRLIVVCVLVLGCADSLLVSLL